MTFRQSAIALLCTLGASPSFAALPKAISFDGYCDGISGIRTSPAGVVTGHWDLRHCPVDHGRFAVTMLRGSHLGQAGQTGTYDTSANPDLLSPSTVIRIDDSGRFTYYDTHGRWMFSGVWSPVSRARRGTGLSVHH